MPLNKRNTKRVNIDREFPSTAMSIDGTWSMDCYVEDVSDSGARLKTFNKVNPRLSKEEFFLLLTSNGKVKRRSKLVWQKGNRLGVRFITSVRTGGTAA